MWMWNAVPEESNGANPESDLLFWEAWLGICRVLLALRVLLGEFTDLLAVLSASFSLISFMPPPPHFLFFLTFCSMAQLSVFTSEWVGAWLVKHATCCTWAWSDFHSLDRHKKMLGHLLICGLKSLFFYLLPCVFRIIFCEFRIVLSARVVPE